MLKILVDDMPHTTLSYDCKDYSSKVLLGLTNEPLFYEINGAYNSRIVDIVENGLEITFRLKEFYWSNGERITAWDLKKSFMFMIENVTMYSNYLVFIDGVYAYLSERRNSDEIKIVIKDSQTLTFNMKYDYDFKKTFSAVEFSPLYIVDGNHDISVTSGPFRIIETNYENIFLKRNECWKGVTNILEILIYHEPDMYRGVEKYLTGEVDITSTTLFPFDLIKKYKNRDDFYQKISNIEFNIIINCDTVKTIKNELRNYVLKKISEAEDMLEGLHILDYKYCPDDILVKSNIGLGKTVNLLYPNYFPNDIICKHISDFLRKNGFEVKIIGMGLKDFIKNVDFKDNYQISLNLFSNTINDEIEYFISYIPYFDNEQEQDEYISLLNKFAKDNTNMSRRYNLTCYLFNKSSRVPFAKVKHLYFKSHRLLNYRIDSNDLLSFI